MYIYTSGTTGLPKAAVIKHARYILAAGGLTSMMGVREGDVMYCPHPLYHSVGGMISLSGCMAWGITMVIRCVTVNITVSITVTARDKFSASQYWSDCVAHKVTVAQYIGETCRYLVNSPPCPAEAEHSIRLMFGNGLRPDIWRRFVERFGIRDISEFYGSTEGNSNILNFDNTVGAVGFVPVLASSLLPLGPVRLGQDGEPVRDPETGLCARCEVGEPGEFVGAIQQNHPVREFAGYSDREATAGKVLRDVWSKGDMCFRSGDILVGGSSSLSLSSPSCLLDPSTQVSDELGYLYFKDRQGDTFRWKGENVSTTEVDNGEKMQRGRRPPALRRS
jgi:solute carrier family 27 fatty acid transporter 1/4